MNDSDQAMMSCPIAASTAQPSSSSSFSDNLNFGFELLLLSDQLFPLLLRYQSRLESHFDVSKSFLHALHVVIAKTDSTVSVNSLLDIFVKLDQLLIQLVHFSRLLIHNLLLTESFILHFLDLVLQVLVGLCFYLLRNVFCLHMCVLVTSASTLATDGFAVINPAMDEIAAFGWVIVEF